MRTRLFVEIEHDLPLPKDILETASGRLWTVLYNQGIKADVSAGRIEVHMQPREWEKEPINALRQPKA